MRKKLNLLVFVIFATLFLAQFVQAGSFTATLETKGENTDEIYKDEVAEFILTINNGADVDQKFLVYTLDPTWIIYADKNIIEVPARTSRSFGISVDPTTAISKSGFYSLGLEVKSATSDELLKVKRDILIKSESHRVFSAAVSAYVDVNENGTIDPRDEVDVKIRLVNRNSLDIDKLSVFVAGKLIQDVYSTSLSPNSEVIKHLTYKLDPYTEPQKDTLAVRVFYRNKSITEKRIPIVVNKNKLFFTRDLVESDEFLYNNYEVTLTNLGNVESEEVFQYDINALEKMFTKTVPESKYVKNEDGGKLEFEVSLNPSEITKIKITTDYRAFVYTTTGIILSVLLIIFLYFTLRSPLVISKKASVVAEKDGGISEIKILVYIKNRTSKVLENIKVVDRIPNITEIEREFSLGTLKPTKIVRHPKKGTLIKWDFPSVDGYEERILTYRIHSKLGILGNFKLPSTIVKFDTPSGVSRRVQSKNLK